MYTQIAFLLFAVQTSAYTLVQTQLENVTDISQVIESTNNSLQGVNDAEHQEMLIIDKTANDSCTDRNCESDNDKTNYYNDETDKCDEIDKLDDSPEVEPFKEVRRKRQLRYQNKQDGQSQHNLDYNRMFTNRQPYDGSTKKTNYPLSRDEQGNVAYDNINSLFSGGYKSNTPRSHGLNVKNDQSYSYNYLNNLQYDPTNNQPAGQPIQQRPVESNTLNNNYPYKSAKQSANTESRNVKQISTSEINEVDNTFKANQALGLALPGAVLKDNINKNVTQTLDTEISRTNGVLDKTTKNNEDLKNNADYLSKKINSMKEKLKDVFSNVNINGVLSSPEGKKLLQSYGTIPTVVKEEITNETPANVDNSLPPTAENLTVDNKSEVELNNTIVTIIDKNANLTESILNDTNNIDRTTEFSENLALEINEEIEKLVETSFNTVNLQQIINNEIAELTLIDQENVTVLSELQNIKNSTTLDEVTDIEKYTVPASVPITTETLNETSITENQEQILTGLVEESKTEVDANNMSIDNFENKDINSSNSKSEIISENRNVEKLLDKDDFKEWISKWAATYMEMLNEKITIYVKDEVAKQLEELYIALKMETEILQRQNTTFQEVKQDNTEDKMATLSNVNQDI